MIPALRRRLRPAAAAFLVTALAGGLLAGTGASTAEAATTCASPAFTRQFFANTTFSGAPRKTDCDAVIAENWGTRAPVSGLPKDRFGVRWSLTRDFGSGGPFAFTVKGRDGIRVYVDGVRKISLWKDVSTARQATLNLSMPSGRHTLRVDFVNWTGSADVIFGYTPRVAAAVDKVRPLAPTGFTAALDTATDTAKLSWTANKEMDLAGYRIYSRAEGAAGYSLRATTTRTTYNVLTTPVGRTSYQVRAYDKAGNVSAGSSERVVTRPAVTTPSGLTVRGVDSGIQLTWKPVPGAVRYQVHRLNYSGVDRYATSTTTSFTDTSVARSVPWMYQVAAEDGAGVVSPYTAAYATGSEARRLVAAPQQFTAAPDADSAVLSWTTNPATGGDYYGFNVYRSTTLPVNTTTQPVPCDFTWKQLADGQDQYTCTDYSAGSNTLYHYVVRGFDAQSVESLSSATATVTTLEEDLTPPAAVTGLTAEATSYGVSLNWNADTEPDLARYVIYQGVLAGDQDAQVCEGSPVDYVAPDTTHYVHRTLPDGDELCYFVDAVDTRGNSSFWWTRTADVVVTTTLNLMPPQETLEGATLQLYAYPNEAETVVNLSWDGAPDAVGYLVYRWNPASGSYEKLTAEAITDQEFTDSTAALGTTHIYRLMAVHQDGSESLLGWSWLSLPPAS